jgi:hypothetical protein
MNLHRFSSTHLESPHSPFLDELLKNYTINYDRISSTVQDLSMSYGFGLGNNNSSHSSSLSSSNSSSSNLNPISENSSQSQDSSTANSTLDSDMAQLNIDEGDHHNTSQ